MLRAFLRFPLSWTGGVCAGIITAGAFAQSASDLRVPLVSGSSSCPDARSVQRVLATLLAPATPNAPAIHVEVTDFGTEYAVLVGGREKKYADANRDCEGRARIAAAFIALVLSPEGEATDTAPATSPSQASAATAPPPPRPFAPAAPSAAPPRSHVPLTRWLRADIDFALDTAPNEHLLGVGGALGVAAGIGLWGAHVHCGWLGGASIDAPGGNGDILIDRFPCALGPAFRFFGQRPGPFEASVDASLALGALQARGRGFAQDYDSVRLEVGARLGADIVFRLDWPVRGLGPRIGVAATYEPAAYDLLVSPRGVVAHTSSLWVGMTGGMSWRME